MPPKITNFLTQGLPSKMYISCYFQPKTGYALAKEIHGSPRVDKIYKWGKILIETGYLKRTKKGYEVIVGPIVDQIAKTLSEQRIRLDHKEKKLLSLLLSSTSFKEIIKSFYHGLSEDNRKQADIASLTMEILPLLSSIALHAKNLAKIPDLSIDEAMSIFADEQQVIARRQSNPGVLQLASDASTTMNRYYENLGMTEKIDTSSPERQIARNAGLSLLHDIPNALLNKLSQLNPIGEYVTIVFALATTLLRKVEQDPNLKSTSSNDKGEQG